MRLEGYTAGEFRRGRPMWVELAWLFVQALLVSCWVPGSRHRVTVLRLFGAKIGRGVVVKPGVRVKFPWRLRVGDHSWLGESVWIDNLEQVSIGSHCCLSQGAYLCTGSHDWSRDSFDLVVRPIVIEDGAWVAAFTRIAPGVIVRRNAVLALGAVATCDLDAGWIYGGVPARRLKRRTGQPGQTTG